MKTPSNYYFLFLWGLCVLTCVPLSAQQDKASPLEKGNLTLGAQLAIEMPLSPLLVGRSELNLGYMLANRWMVRLNHSFALINFRPGLLPENTRVSLPYYGLDIGIRKYIFPGQKIYPFIEGGIGARYDQTGPGGILWAVRMQQGAHIQWNQRWSMQFGIDFWSQRFPRSEVISFTLSGLRVGVNYHLYKEHR